MILNDFGSPGAHFFVIFKYFGCLFSLSVNLSSRARPAGVLAMASVMRLRHWAEWLMVAGVFVPCIMMCWHLGQCCVYPCASRSSWRMYSLRMVVVLFVVSIRSTNWCSIASCLIGVCDFHVVVNISLILSMDHFDGVGTCEIVRE